MGKIGLVFLGLFLGTGYVLGAQAQEITGDQARSMLLGTPKPILVDVRTKAEFDASHIPGAINFPLDEITATTARSKLGDAKTPIIVYCQSGRRSGIAAATLVQLGYKSIADLGPISAWKWGYQRTEKP